MIEQAPILVTGAARSGSGMIAGVLNKCGAFGGIMTNKRGLYENDQIRETIVKPYLKQDGSDTNGQKILPDTQAMLIPRYWKKRVEEVMLAEGYTGGAWMYKDARIALMWPIWHYAFPNAKWLIVRRRTGDIIQSCMKTAYMNAYETEEGWLTWVHEYEQRFIEMISEGVNVKVIWPERMVNGDYQQLHETLNWLGLPWKSEIFNFIDPLLWSSRKKKGGQNGTSDNR